MCVFSIDGVGKGSIGRRLSSGPVNMRAIRALYAPCQGEEHVACWGWGGGVGGERIGYWGSHRAVFLLVQAVVLSVSYVR